VIDAPWAASLVRAAHLRPGDHVLDIGWPADLVAHLAADRVAPGGVVVGHGAHAWPAPLPFEDGSFDVVVGLQALQRLTDRGQALIDVGRVLAPHGRAALVVWGPIERNPAFAALADSLERHRGVRAAASVRWLFSMPDPADVRATLAAAGFWPIRIRTAQRTVRFPSVAEFLRRYLPSSATTDPDEETTRRVVADLETALAAWVDDRGLRVRTESNTAVASRPHGPPADRPTPVVRSPSRHARVRR
jgi:SAM-dependent methyltransferase